MPEHTRFSCFRLAAESGSGGSPCEPRRPPRSPTMDLLDVAMQGLALFGLILFAVLWLMHFMSIIYV